MRHSGRIYFTLISFIGSSLVLNFSVSASINLQNTTNTIRDLGSKDWTCSLPIISFMGNRFDTPITLRLKAGAVRIQAIELREDKESFRHVDLISFRNETDRVVKAVRLTLILINEDTPDILLQKWESELIVFESPLLEWKSIINANSPLSTSQKAINGSSLKENYELGVIHLNSILKSEFRRGEKNDVLMIEVKVSEIVYEVRTV